MSATGWRAFDLSICRWILKTPYPENLSDVATAALVAGCDGEALVRLACMDQATWSELPPAVAAVFRERGLITPTTADALKLVADDILVAMAEGRLGIRVGTRDLYELISANFDEPGAADLSAFIGFDDAFYLADEGVCGTPEQVHADVVAAVGRLLDRGGVRVK